MSIRKEHGSSDQHHQRGAEMHDGAAHAHIVAAEAHEKQDHQSGHERSRQALEHTQKAHEHTNQSHHNSVDGNGEIAHADVAILAHGLWEARGCPDGSPEEDWFHAAQQLQVRGQAVAK